LSDNNLSTLPDNFGQLRFYSSASFLGCVFSAFVNFAIVSAYKKTT